jgi:hypothetical protein
MGRTTKSEPNETRTDGPQTHVHHHRLPKISSWFPRGCGLSRRSIAVFIGLKKKNHMVLLIWLSHFIGLEKQNCSLNYLFELTEA